jgi:hypothetical protein
MRQRRWFADEGGRGQQRAISLTSHEQFFANASSALGAFWALDLGTCQQSRTPPDRHYFRPQLFAAIP